MASIKHIVDAHALVWFLEGNPRLGHNAAAVMADPTSSLVLPSIALAEACWVIRAGRTRIPTVQHLLSDIAADPRISVAPLDRAIVETAFGIQIPLELHDLLILATAIHYSQQGQPASLLTKDKDLSGSALVPVVW